MSSPLTTAICSSASNINDAMFHDFNLEIFEELCEMAPPRFRELMTKAHATLTFTPSVVKMTLNNLNKEEVEELIRLTDNGFDGVDMEEWSEDSALRKMSMNMLCDLEEHNYNTYSDEW